MTVESKEFLLEKIKDNLDNPLFRGFLSSLFSRWEKLEAETNAINFIIKKICEHYSITQEEMIRKNRYYEARSVLFYVLIKKVNLSYGEAGDLFKFSRGAVHRAVSEADVMVNKARKKNLVALIADIDRILVFPEKKQKPDVEKNVKKNTK